MAQMETVYPISSMISSIDYDDETLELDIEFESGGTYTYENVPEEVYRAFIAADSVGKFFHAVIKNQYA